MEIYLERVGGRGELGDEAFEAMAITHPLAQPEAHGNRRLRHILGRSPGGGLLCATHIPAGTAIEFTVLSLDELLRSGWDSVTSSVESLGDHEPEAATARWRGSRARRVTTTTPWSRSHSPR